MPPPATGQSGPTTHDGPVGSGEYQVQPGDCLLSIAFEHGHVWETLWDHPSNSEVKQVREKPQLLVPGDLLHIPDLQLREESVATAAKHRFRRKGVPAKFILRLTERTLREQDAPADSGDPPPPPEEEHEVTPADATYEFEDKPLANKRYSPVVDGNLTSGQTDGDGKIELTIPPNAREGRLTLEPGTPAERSFTIRLGHLDPISTRSGVVQRLSNLGYRVGSGDDESLRRALIQFQTAQGLDPTGELDDAVRDALEQTHGS